MKRHVSSLPPFAPDMSGAVSALFGMGGLIVICDAGGCTGNVCGFDEPRWFTRKSAIFSAGLRDMDAILGRDDQLVGKVQDAMKVIDAPFSVLVGTPVPAVIGTDFRALRKLLETKIHRPALTIETTGTQWYDVGEEKANLALFQTFATKAFPQKPESVGILGASPLDCSCLTIGETWKRHFRKEGIPTVVCYGMDDGLDAVKQASAIQRNLVVSPSGLPAARYLRETFGTPYDVGFPLCSDTLDQQLASLVGLRVLVIHQQVLANEIRNTIRKNGDADVTVASWFLLDDELKQDGDFMLHNEDEFAQIVQKEQYQAIVCDRALWRAIPSFDGILVDLPHFAVSGRLV
ncbi:MAG: hypothetical protein LKE39_00350 [Sphaerochaeta sp.]|jgi:nitrogenase molybdenum-iron protein alpha/beta subunit|nr:hypothetical protein [Sphaerochaeta sp.]MCH3918947.1 hypothetical protein [Sphaerochaeta sp.]MCI2075720.1 hypothetical protein [Sphaerochaeta sp.]MCI2097367.1 hypothetical protein [Sphaerochaeta sp.]